jgi:hypothetical protein
MGGRWMLLILLKKLLKTGCVTGNSARDKLCPAVKFLDRFWKKLATVSEKILLAL